MALSIEFDAQGIVKVNGSAVNGVQFSGFTLGRKPIYTELVGCLAQRTKRLFFSFPSREGGSESIYWSKR